MQGHPGLHAVNDLYPKGCAFNSDLSPAGNCSLTPFVIDRKVRVQQHKETWQLEFEHTWATSLKKWPLGMTHAVGGIIKEVTARFKRKRKARLGQRRREGERQTLGWDTSLLEVAQIILQTVCN